MAGCAVPTKSQLHMLAEDIGLESREVEGQGYRHLVYSRPGVATGAAGSRLHVYIHGDGTPWLGRGRPAADPTPRNPLALRLMAQDPHPAVYLGRPCYGGVQTRQHCSPWDWTHGRYSTTLVESMVAALEEIRVGFGATSLTLIGYSGGGTLAMLMAARIAQVDRVVTLAGNLDVAAWTAHHGYSPLSGSLDPAQRPPLPARIRQWHWVGDRDRSVPAPLLRGALRNQPGVRLTVLAGVDHACCWVDLWPELLAEFASPAYP